MRPFAFTIFCLITLFAVNCSRNDKPPEKKDFIVDSSLVQKKEIFPKYQFSFHPPLNWNRLPKEMFNEFKERLRANYPHERGVIYHPIDLFYNSEDKSLLYITSIGFIGIKLDPLEEYDEIMKNSTNEPIENHKYLKDDLIIMQYIIHENDRVNYKAVFSSGNNTLIQFDYILMEAVYQNELNAVESSLGALALLE